MRVASPRLLKFASVLTMISLGLMVWAVLHPVPLAVMAAMSIGQAIGTLGALLFGVVVYRDLRQTLKRRSEADLSEAPSSEAPSSEAPSSEAPSSEAPSSEASKSG